MIPQGLVRESPDVVAVTSRHREEHIRPENLREEYANLIHQQLENSDNLSDPTNTDLRSVILRCNELQQHVASTQDASYDSESIRISVNLSAAQVSSISTLAPGLDVESFIRRVKEVVGAPENQKDGEISWGRLAECDLGTWKKVPRLDAVLGTVELGLDEKALIAKTQEQRERQEQRQLRRQQTQQLTQAARNRGEGEKTKAADVSELAPDEDLDTEKLVTEVRRALERAAEASQNGKVPFWIFILNPNSFGESVENLFYTSFLIKNGKAKLEVIENVLYISPARSGGSRRRRLSSDGGGDNRNGPTFQAVVSFNYKAWSELAERRQGIDPMIERPRREHD